MASIFKDKDINQKRAVIPKLTGKEATRQNYKRDTKTHRPINKKASNKTSSFNFNKSFQSS